MSWTEKTRQSETWSDKSQQSETWSPKSEQAEGWTSQMTVRAYDPYGFSNTPDFDTGIAAGVWAEKTQQGESWA